MGHIDKQRLADDLETLRKEGALLGWTTRPLGMYWLHLADGRELRPDTGETAMWVMGVSYRRWFDALQEISAPSPDPEQVAEYLDRAADSWILRAWGRDRDGQYVLTFCDGDVATIAPQHIAHWCSCMLYCNDAFAASLNAAIRKSQAEPGNDA